MFILFGGHKQISFTMQGLLPTSILAVAFIAVLTAFPTKRSCQRNKDVRSLLRDALGLSNVVAQQSSVLSQEMSRKWPTDPYQETTIDFFLHLQNFNKTADKPMTVLKRNCFILRTFIPLLENSTKQLNRFEVDESVKSQLLRLKRQTKTLISCLRRIMAIMSFQQRGQQGANQPASREDQKIIGTSSIGSALTIQDLTFQTKLILDEFYSNALNLKVDLWDIKVQTCN